MTRAQPKWINIKIRFLHRKRFNDGAYDDQITDDKNPICRRTIRNSESAATDIKTVRCMRWSHYSSIKSSTAMTISTRAHTHSRGLVYHLCMAFWVPSLTTAAIHSSEHLLRAMNLNLLLSWFGWSAVAVAAVIVAMTWAHRTIVTLLIAYYCYRRIRNECGKIIFIDERVARKVFCFALVLSNNIPIISQLLTNNDRIQ